MHTSPIASKHGILSIRPKCKALNDMIQQGEDRESVIGASSGVCLLGGAALLK